MEQSGLEHDGRVDSASCRSTDERAEEYAETIRQVHAAVRTSGRHGFFGPRWPKLGARPVGLTGCRPRAEIERLRGDMGD
jgi:hypothetical protein